MRIMSDVPAGAKRIRSSGKLGGFSAARCSGCCQKIWFINRDRGHTAVWPRWSSRGAGVEEVRRGLHHPATQRFAYSV